LLTNLENFHVLAKDIKKKKTHIVQGVVEDVFVRVERCPRGCDWECAKCPVIMLVKENTENKAACFPYMYYEVQFGMTVVDGQEIYALFMDYTLVTAVPKYDGTEINANNKMREELFETLYKSVFSQLN